MLSLSKRLIAVALLAGSVVGGAQASAVNQFLNFNDTNPSGGFFIEDENAIITGTILEIDVFGSLAQGVAPFGLDTSVGAPVQSMFDTISFDIVAPDGFYISEVFYSEGLSTTISSSDGWAIASGSLTVNSESRTLGTNIYEGLADTNFAMDATVDLTGQQMTTVSVAITNSIIAVAGGGVSTISKGYDNNGKVFPKLEVTLEAVPVPAAVWLFGSAVLGFAAFSRRKRL